jgi:hypothetical protein
MGIAKWSLGVLFSWWITALLFAMHLNLSGFASNLVKHFFRDVGNPAAMATSYCSGVPIEAIVPSLDENNAPAQVQQKEAYQSLVGSMGWLAHTTWPDLATVHSFLSSYSNKPSVVHMKAVLYALHYIHSTEDCGISFTSEDLVPMHCFVHYPHLINVGAYTDIIPPSDVNSLTLLSYNDACWGSHIGSAVADGTFFPFSNFEV